MEKTLQKRLVGTAVMIALAVIFVPMMLDGSKEAPEAVSMQISIPPKPVYNIPNRLTPPVEVTSEEATLAEEKVAESSAKGVKEEETAKVADTEKPIAAKVAKAEEEKKATPQVVEIPASASKIMETTIEKKAVSQLASAGKGVGFVVQVGSFSSKDNAESLKKSLAGSGYPSFVELTQLKTRDIFRVKVGPKPTRKEANRLRLELIDEEKLEGIIVSFP